MAARFSFSLETLLRIRQSRERQQELLWQQANFQVATVQRQIEGIQSQIAARASRQRRELQSGWSAAELQFDLLCRTQLQERLQCLQADLAKARVSQACCAENFRRARQQREVLETLRQQRLQLHRQQVSRQEQRQFDDVFLARRTFGQRG